MCLGMKLLLGRLGGSEGRGSGGFRAREARGSRRAGRHRGSGDMFII